MSELCTHCNGVGTLPVVYTFNGAAMPDLGRYFCNRCNGSGVAVESDRDRLCAFALSLAVLTWIADTFEADRETARVCIALDTLVRFSAARGVAIPPLNADVVENVMPVDYAQRAKARAELDAWMQAGIDGAEVEP